MPPPVKAQILPFVQKTSVSADFKGAYAKDLEDIIAESVVQALSIFAQNAKVLPGIPAVVAPPPSAPVGSTLGPGILIPPPAGGPDKSVIKPLVDALFASKGFTGENISDVADVISEAIATGILLFTSMIKVAPGIPIAGGVTAAPGVFV